MRMPFEVWIGCVASFRKKNGRSDEERPRKPVNRRDLKTYERKAAMVAAPFRRRRTTEKINPKRPFTAMVASVGCAEILLKKSTIEAF